MATLSESGQYYKVGNDVFRTSDNAHIDLTAFKQLGLNFALLPEGKTSAQKLLSSVPIGQSAEVSAQQMGLPRVPTGGVAGTPTYAVRPDSTGPTDSPAYQNAKSIASNPYANPAEKADAIKFLKSVDPNFVVPGTTSTTTATTSLTGDSTYDAILSQLNTMMQNITSRGLAVNPYFDFSSPEGMKKVAEFTAQAQNEIDPYYANQLTQARSELLRNIGYSADQILAQEKQYETQYGRQVTTIGEQTAEQGFAQSGKRMLQEQQLASDTQFNLEQARKSAQYQAGTQAAGFGQKFGELPVSPTISETPTVVAGQRTFQQSPIQTPLYSISPDLYAGISQQQQEKTVAKQNRISQLESAFSQDYAVQQQRKLTL
ncbi:MAG: hypothetical protein KGI08_00230 [Thaumarchaeota archaeon]|nr:hypothetical protein [Nitrososphaerota archaeon]